MVERIKKGKKAQSSLELLITLAFGLAILLPLVLLAFIQLANTSTSLSGSESQQAASKLSTVATLIGNEGPPAKQLVPINVPPGVAYVYIGTQTGQVGHEITFVIRGASGESYVTSYTPVNISGQLGGITPIGTYIINVSAQANCPTNPAIPCVYLSETT